MKMQFTGERMVTDIDPMWGTIEHLHRYALASGVCSGKKILDIASGEGYGSHLLAAHAGHVIGVDISAAAVTHAKAKYQRDNLEFKVGSADQIPLEANSVDVVVSFETLEHHDKHEEMFLELKRVLKPNGFVLLSSPEKSIYSKRDPNNPFHTKELTFQELKNLVRKHFKNAKYYSQRAIVGTLVTAEDETANQCKVFDGDFDKIENQLMDHEFFYKPFYNLVLCSNSEMLEGVIPSASLFNGAVVYDSLRKEIEVARAAVRRERAYRLGHMLLFPARVVKNLLRKI